MKKSIFFKSSLAAVAALLMASCSVEDNSAIDPVIETADLDLTALVSTSGWNQGGFAGTWAAPEVKTADGRTSQMAEIYHGSNDGIAETGVMMQQTLNGLTNGKYIVELYANSLYTPNRGFDSDMQDGATDVAYVFANEKQVPIVAKVAETTAENGLYTIYVKVTDGTLTLGLGKNKAGTNWHTIQIKSLTIKDQPVEKEDPQEEEPAEKTDFTDLVATDGWGGAWCATQYAPAVTTADGRTAQMQENYQGNVDATGVLLQQTIEIANGTYNVELYANAFFTSGRGFESDMQEGAMDVAYVFANDVKCPVVGQIATATEKNGEYALEVTVTDGKLTLGLGKEKAGTDWHTIQIKSLTLKK